MQKLVLTLACLRYRRKASSSGSRNSNACPLPSIPRAVLPTLWIYSCQKVQKKFLESFFCLQIHVHIHKHRFLAVITKYRHLPLGHQEDQIELSNPLGGCPSLLQPHQYKGECLLLHYRTQKMLLFSFVAFVSPKMYDNMSSLHKQTSLLW